MQKISHPCVGGHICNVLVFFPQTTVKTKDVFTSTYVQKVVLPAWVTNCFMYYLYSYIVYTSNARVQSHKT